MFPAYFPLLKKEAIIAVKDEKKREIIKSLQKKGITYGEEYKKIIDEYVKKNLDANDIEKKYRELKDFYQDEYGQTYLLGLDSYCWMRLVKQIIKTGSPGDLKINGENYDSYMLSPIGHKLNKYQPFFYLAAYSYKATLFFIPTLRVETFLFYFPLLLTIIFLVLLYFFCKRIFSDIVAFWTVLFVGLSQIVMQRSIAGWFDYDIMTLIFPLLILWCVLLAISGKKITKTIIYSILAAFLIIIFSYTWIGWWLFFIIIIGSAFLLMLNEAYLSYTQTTIDQEKKKKTIEVIKPFIISLISILFIILFFSIITKNNLFLHLWNNLISSLSIANPTKDYLWPNVYYTVSELHVPLIKEIFSNLHHLPVSYLAFFFLIVFFILEISVHKRERKKSYYLSIISLIWFFITFFSSLKGIRFSLYLSIPLGIGIGVGIEWFLKIIPPLLKKIPIKEIYQESAKIIVISLFFIAILFSMFDNGKNSALYIFPLLNDPLYNVLKQIREKTGKKSIINSWWDYGNFFKEIADRGVIFDGQTQNRPLSFWMARVLLSHNETMAINILRMLNNTSDQLFYEINKYLKDRYKTLHLLLQVLNSDINDAKKILKKYNLPLKIEEKILKSIFIQDPSEAYFVVEKSMINKFPAISFIGNWDYMKAYIMRNLNRSKEKLLQELEEKFSLTDEEIKESLKEMINSLSAKSKRIEESISKRFGYISYNRKGKEENGIVYFNNEIVLDTYTVKAKKYIYRGRWEDFKYVYIYDNKGLLFRKNPKGKIPYALLVKKDIKNNEWLATELDNEIITSLFTKLYFMEGRGLKHFKLFISDEEADIYVYKINW